MLKAAKRRTAEMPNVDLRRGDLEALPIEAGECDAAMLLLALTYVPDPAAVVKEMSRILKPGGRAVVVDLQPHDREDFRVEMGQQHRGIDSGELEQMMREAGFAQTSTRPISPEPNVKGPALFLTTGTTNN
jgi:SAM-dependent methyltransferase